MTRQNADHQPDTPQPLAAALACVFPGLGHIYLRQKRRAAMVALGVLGLFFTGLLTAGIDAVDSGAWYIARAHKMAGKPAPFVRTDGDPIWFLGEMFCGPIAFGVDYYHQTRLKVLDASGTLRTALPNEIRNPRTGAPIQVRDDDNNQPLQFTDPATGQVRLSTPADRPPYVKPLARVAEIGTLSCTLAGMLNLIAIIDCAFNRRREEDEGAAQ
ncbi:MAG: hypothetical protein Q8L55_06185 [Phycisphaerales bacterium]|nr:hypothetical protein [Phycisphaerales bacterium]